MVSVLFVAVSNSSFYVSNGSCGGDFEGWAGQGAPCKIYEDYDVFFARLIEYTDHWKLSFWSLFLSLLFFSVFAPRRMIHLADHSSWDLVMVDDIPSVILQNPDVTVASCRAFLFSLSYTINARAPHLLYSFTRLRYACIREGTNRI